MIDLYSSRLISSFINAKDVSFSMQLNLLLARITIYFFLFCVIFNNFIIIPVNVIPKCVLAIPTGTLIILAKK